MNESWQRVQNLVCRWASDRGQTLARTGKPTRCSIVIFMPHRCCHPIVRGLCHIRSALLLLAELEIGGDSIARERLIDTKFQFIIAAQVFGDRKQHKHRTAIRQLMREHPFIEVCQPPLGFQSNVSVDTNYTIARRDR
jgi:hypothetical protein